MSIEDVVLSTVRKAIRGHILQVDTAEIPLRLEAEQLIALSHRTPSSSSRESEDDTPMAGAWYSRSRREKAGAEARVEAHQATRLRPDAEAKEGAETQKAHQEAKEARLEAEEKTR